MAETINNLPPIQEQAEIIKKLKAKSDISTENGAYAVDSSWMKSFYQKKENIGPIDNSKFSTKDGQMKPKQREGEDFEILSKEVWDQLLSWYGGGPTVKLAVVQTEAEGLLAVSKFIPIKLIYKGDSTEFVINNFMKVQDVIDYARKYFKISEDEPIQLIDFFNGHYNATMQSDSLLQRYKLSDDQDVVVDYKDSDGKWKNMPEKTKSTNSYINTSTVSRTMSADLNPTRQYSTTAGKVGLSNLGNTCFFNSGTQCLMHSMPFIKYFIDGSWQKWINLTNKLGTKGALATTFANVARKMWSENPESCIRPIELKHAVGRFAPRFSGYEQHDSHELIMFMLDGIHEDLNRCVNKPYIESVTGDGSNDQAVADESWKRHKLRNDSIVVDHFHGLLRSELLCPKCHKTTVVFDPYLSIPLPLARENDRNLKIIFVPYNSFQEEWINLTITINISYIGNPRVISDAISAKLGREVTVAPGTFVTYSKKLNWGYTDTNTYYKSTLYAFEVPDVNKFYVPCLLYGDVKSQYNSTTTSDLIAPPFIVECKLQEDGNYEPFDEEIKNKIQPLFNQDADCELTEEVAEYLNRIVPKETEYNGSFEKDFWQREAAPKRHKVITFVSTTPYKINVDTSKLNLKLAVQNMPLASKTLTRSKSSDGDRVTLDNCFKLFSTPDTLDEQNQWYCPHCKDFVCADKKLDIWNTPELLIIQLKRFSGGGWSIRKDDTYVDFPDTLDMSKYTLSHPEGVSQIYRLYAVSEHMGGMGGGHYIAHARVTTKPDDPGNWYCFDDSHCAPASPDAAHSPLAYVLFYQRVDQ